MLRYIPRIYIKIEFDHFPSFLFELIWLSFLFFYLAPLPYNHAHINSRRHGAEGTCRCPNASALNTASYGICSLRGSSCRPHSAFFVCNEGKCELSLTLTQHPSLSHTFDPIFYLYFSVFFSSTSFFQMVRLISLPIDTQGVMASCEFAASEQGVP